MATKQATNNYTSRRAVSGSNAYDLSRIREYSNETTEPIAAPVRKAPEQPYTRSSQRARSAQKAYGISLLAMVGFVVVGVMMVFVLLANIKYNEVTNDTVKLQTRLHDLTEQERKLKIAYEEAFDVNNVEQYATNVLGMSKPDKSQVSTIETIAYDKAVVVSPENDKTAPSETMATFLVSLIAYLK